MLHYTYFNGGRKLYFEVLLERAPDQIGRWLEVPEESKA